VFQAAFGPPFHCHDLVNGKRTIEVDVNSSKGYNFLSRWEKRISDSDPASEPGFVVIGIKYFTRSPFPAMMVLGWTTFTPPSLAAFSFLIRPHHHEPAPRLL
jgi:hypothetical protein